MFVRPASIAMLAARLLAARLLAPGLLAPGLLAGCVAVPLPPPLAPGLTLAGSNPVMAGAPTLGGVPASSTAAPVAPAREQVFAAAGFALSPVDGAAAATTLRLEVPDGVLFDSADDQPLPGASAVLARLAAAERQAGAALTVLGHTDAVGSDAYNLDLSARRARSVIAMLAVDGVDRAAMSAVAIGRRQPLASNATPSGRARNRRVEFLLGDTLAGNLAAVGLSGRGEVAVLRPDPAGGAALVEAGQVALAQPLAEATASAPSAGPQRRRPEAPAALRINQPEAVRRAPLADTPSY